LEFFLGRGFGLKQLFFFFFVFEEKQGAFGWCCEKTSIEFLVRRTPLLSGSREERVFFWIFFVERECVKKHAEDIR